MSAEFMTGGGKQWIVSLSQANFTHENFTGSEIDEVQIEDWFLLEKLENNYWFLRIGSEEYTILPNKTLRLEHDALD